MQADDVISIAFQPVVMFLPLPGRQVIAIRPALPMVLFLSTRWSRHTEAFFAKDIHFTYQLN